MVSKPLWIVDRLLPSLQTPENVMHGPLAINFSSCDLIPTENYAELVALKTFGDGNCCFRAASPMLFGTEQNYLAFRVRTIVELAKYSFFYLKKAYLPLSPSKVLLNYQIAGLHSRVRF